GEDPPRRLVAGDARVLDDRHVYLALALSEPKGARARQIAARFASAGAADPVVAAASALLQSAGSAAVRADAPRALLARDASDPLLAAAALRLAEKAGDDDAARRARTALAAMGEPRRHVD
ncbi:MAG TPA: hypothetical protein VE987_16785, partial [Polyangiaceae bacterium]|nr:hypothetical protein [Polyangiaceae bacterium]